MVKRKNGEERRKFTKDDPIPQCQFSLEGLVLCQSPQERHSVFLLPSRSVKNISWFSFAISMIHFGREINTSPDPVSPDPWNDNTTLRHLSKNTH